MPFDWLAEKGYEIEPGPGNKWTLKDLASKTEYETYDEEGFAFAEKPGGKYYVPMFNAPPTGVENIVGNGLVYMVPFDKFDAAAKEREAKIKAGEG